MSRGRRTIAETRRTPAARTIAAAQTFPANKSQAKTSGNPTPAPSTNAGFLAQPGASTTDKTGQIGTPGTLNLAGFISQEDYNHDLDGLQAMAVYDEMRRSDAQVQAVLLMCTLRLKAADWTVMPVSDDPQDLAIADFVKACMLDDDAMEVPWSDVLDNALLKLPFGCSAHEKIWFVDTIDGKSTIRIKRLAPRLPRTFYRWVEDPTSGDLVTLQQFAPKAGKYGFWDIPRENLVLHVLNREGNNYYGRSMLRAAYPHWWRKNQLYRIDMVRLDRWGVGIPRAKLDKDFSDGDTPLSKLEEILKGLRSYDRGYFIEPVGVTVDLLVPNAGGGRGGATGLLEMVEHHNMLIARSAIQGFAAQGEQNHGSYGAAQITYEAFEDAEYGTAREIAAEFRNDLIKQLCELNFDMSGGRKVPILQCAGLGKIDITEMADPLQKLAAAKFLTPSDEDEEWVRSAGKMPKMSEEARGRDRSPTVPIVGDPNDPNAPPKFGNKPPAKKVEAAQPRYSEGARAFAREPNDLERRVFNLHAVPATLDEAKARLIRQVADLRKEQVRTLAQKIAKKDARTSTAAFTDIRPEEFPVAGVGAIAQAIRATQTRVAAYGAEQVRAELQKQGRFQNIAAAGAADSKKMMTSALVSSAKFTARKVATQWRDLALENALRLRRSGLVGDALVNAIVQELDDNLEIGLSQALGGEVNEAFGLGRATTAGENTDEIEKAIYSCVLDANSCDPCIELDGEEYEVGSPEYDAATPPYKNCEGRDNCRCVYIYVLKSGA